MDVHRFTDEEAKSWNNEKLVGTFEITSRKAYDTDATVGEQEVHHKNLATLYQEIYRRMT